MKHIGPYERFYESYTAAFRYIDEHGYKVVDHPRTCYIDGAWNQDDPEKPRLPPARKRMAGDELYSEIMKLKKRKLKYAAIFFLCWFALLVFLVDGVLKFQTLVDYFGSYALVESMLLLLVILPTLAVYKFTKEYKQ